MSAKEPQAEDKKVYLRTRVPSSLHRRFKLLSVEMGITMEDIAAELIEGWVDKQEKKKRGESK